jgi:hypothetical protein
MTRLAIKRSNGLRVLRICVLTDVQEGLGVTVGLLSSTPLPQPIFREGEAWAKHPCSTGPRTDQRGRKSERFGAYIQVPVADGARHFDRRLSWSTDASRRGR